MAFTQTDPLLNARKAAELLGVSISTFFRRVADGTFPEPIKLGHLSRWPQSELLDTIEHLKAARCGSDADARTDTFDITKRGQATSDRGEAHA